MTAGVSTLVASASIARTDGSPQRGRGSLFEHLSIGQNLRLQVLRQLEQHRYEVAFGGRRHIVESRVPLHAGSQIEAQVEAKGDQLELRYLGLGPRSSQPEQPAFANLPADDAAPATASNPAVPAWIQSLAEQFRVTLGAEAQATIARSAAQASDPQLMTRGGLFLQKLAQHVNPADLAALYRVLNTAERHVPAAALQAPLDINDLVDSDDLASSLADALDSATPLPMDSRVETVGDDAHAGEGESDSQRAVRLLNLQDEGSVAWRYGTLPLLIGGQLIELDLVMFREREQQGARGGLKRLVMSLDTTHFGRVHVEARAVDSRLMVTLSAESTDAVEVLSAYGGEVRSAIEQLGWAVDEVRYELKAPHASPAQEIVKHVLSAGTVDREL